MQDQPALGRAVPRHLGSRLFEHFCHPAAALLAFE